ncbi:DUF7710 domain-containing protein [Chryseobacterium wangxinyae]|uniref:DUF7710 domain-containing protein n=1 Tax=Chryseobacterium sp. CY353 TaxID=2997334 RepID=UPI002270D4A4|nr:hypothetical protein [Chryseobacterium sp. CY353]MCY0969092.1 hypothetical protein [Chryseobacterium sp. CY353]
MKEKQVFVFNGEESNFPSGIFTTLEKAKVYIEKYSLSGILTQFPIDIGIYDWAIQKDFFSVKNEYQKEPRFIERFSCASIEHFHFKNGKVI